MNRKAYSEDAQGIIRRQRAAIEKLQGENTAIKHELDVSADVRALRASVPRLSPPPVQDAGTPNLSAQQELLRLRETALVFTRKARLVKPECPPACLTPPTAGG